MSFRLRALLLIAGLSIVLVGCSQSASVDTNDAERRGYSNPIKEPPPEAGGAAGGPPGPGVGGPPGPGAGGPPPGTGGGQSPS